MTFKDLKRRLESQQSTFSSEFAQLLNKPFWIWDKQEHLRLAQQTNEQCCFNHIVGLPIKDKVEHPIYDYEKILYDYLITMADSSQGSFQR